MLFRSIDEVEARGDQIDAAALDALLKVRVVPTVASRGRGVKELMDRAIQTAQGRGAGFTPPLLEIFPENIQNSIAEIENKIMPMVGPGLDNPRWKALKLLEGDKKVQEKLHAPVDILDRIRLQQEVLKAAYGKEDIETIVADSRYQFASRAVGQAVRRNAKASQLTVSDRHLYLV